MYSSGNKTGSKQYKYHIGYCKEVLKFYFYSGSEDKKPHSNCGCKGSRLKADLDGGLNAVPIGMDADKKKR